MSQTNFSITSSLEELRYFVTVMDKGAGCSSLSRGLRMHRALGLLSINKKKIKCLSGCRVAPERRLDISLMRGRNSEKLRRRKPQEIAVPYSGRHSSLPFL